MTSKGKKRFLSILRMPENKDKSLHYAVLGLALMGSFMIVSTNVGNTTSNSLAIVTVSIKQILFIIAGYTAMMLASKLMNFRLIYRLDKILVFVVLLLMIVPLFGKAYLGSRAWIYLNLGVTTVSIQPSEFCKPLMIVLIASYFYAAQQRRSYQRSAWKMLKVPIISYLLFALVILLQKDIGALAILTLICFGCMQVPPYPSLVHVQNFTRRLTVLGVCCVLLGMTPIGMPVVEKLSELPLVDHVATRFVNAANPLGTEEDDLYGQSYQPANALYGIAFFSSSVRSFSSISTGSIFFSSGSGTSGAVGSSVSWGTASAAAVGSRVSSGIMLSVMVIVPFYLILFVYLHFPEGAAPWAALLSGSFYSSSWMPSPSSPLSLSSAAGVSFRVWWMGSSLSPSRAIMFSSTVISVEISSA